MPTELRKMKKFRFQLLHKWIVNNYKPCKIADIGWGKWLLSYLLNQNWFISTVIDPFEQKLPEKFKDLDWNKHKISNSSSIRRISKEYEINMWKYYDLQIGVHAHWSNMKTIESCAKFNNKFILMPCCVIDEPINIKENINWFKSLEDYANNLWHKTKRFELNFKWQNIWFYNY